MSSFPVSIRVETESDLGPLHPIYRFFGADEINYVYMRDGQKLLTKLGALGKDQVFFRAHQQFNTGKGVHALKWGSTNVYTEDADGTPVYDWTIIDQIYDTILANNVKPYVQFGFMPKALSTHPEPYQHTWTATAPYSEIFTGWSYPPKSFQKWEELCFQWTKHVVERYGEEEVKGWYWETWNEPNIGYWQGTHAEFCALHDYTVAAVRRAYPGAFVGGPETADAGVDYLRDFFEHCVRGKNHATGEIGSPLDFLSFHAKGKPVYMEKEQYVRMDIGRQLRLIDDAFGVIASFPELKDKPIVIGESDPEGAAAAQGPQLRYRNGTMYSSYTAASFARKHDLASKHGVNLDGALTWAFEFEDQPFFAGFRVLATNDVDLPVLNVHRLFAKMGGRRIKAASSNQAALDAVLKGSVRETPDVGSLASVDDAGRVCVLIWHYHDDDVPGPAANVDVALEGLSLDTLRKSKITHWRVDGEHSNSFEAWKKIGSPENPTESQLDGMKEAGQLELLKTETRASEKAAVPLLSFDLPRQAVSLVVVERQ
jgi:xylan 1,4-beta-xylosidase